MNPTTKETSLKNYAAPTPQVVETAFSANKKKQSQDICLVGDSSIFVANVTLELKGFEQR